MARMRLPATRSSTRPGPAESFAFRFGILSCCSAQFTYSTARHTMRLHSFARKLSHERKISFVTDWSFGAVRGGHRVGTGIGGRPEQDVGRWPVNSCHPIGARTGSGYTLEGWKTVMRM